MKTPFSRSYQITKHMLSCEGMLEDLGLLKKVPDQEQHSKYLKKLKAWLKSMGLLRDIPASEMVLVAQGKKSIGDVLVAQKLVHVVLDVELNRLNQLEGKRLKNEFAKIGILESIPADKRVEIFEKGMLPSPAIRHLNLIGFVLEFALDRLNNQGEGRVQIFKESDRCPFKLVSLQPKIMYDAVGDAWHGTIHATETVSALCFNESLPTEQITSYCDSNRAWAGNIKHLMALAAEHPQLVQAVDYGEPIVALGSEVGGGVPTFSMSTHGVVLGEAFFSGGKWPPKARFITVPKHY